jgi:signal transduction histidine kinase/ActR/RegA family two-component response regulator
MILGRIATSVRRKLMLVIFGATFTALSLAAFAMVLFEAGAYRQSWIDDLTTQAKIVARTSAPAMSFNDPKTAQGNLALLRERPQILAAAIYSPDGTRFADYTGPDAGSRGFPARPGTPGYEISGDQLVVVHPVVENNEVLGTVYLRAKYQLAERVQSYLLILLAVMAGSLLIAALVTLPLQATITEPILSVTNVAKQVIRDRDFSLRARKTTEDEIGVLVDAFNGMLNEVARRAAALEESNLSLAQEMGVRREVEAALVTADRRKDEFLATLAHELRNPLAPISTGLDILRLSTNNPAAAAEAREIMERQLAKMVRLIDDLLDVSRITTGKLGIRKHRVELQSVVQDAVETVRPFIESCDHTLVLELPAAPVFLSADPTRLAQVFSNLLNNAAKYTARGGRIGFAAKVEEGHVVARVTDTGIGIAEEMLARVFDMFTQVDYSLERTQAGLGVGLTLAKRLVELHGGTIEARSEGLNQGSEFVVRLPIAGAVARPTSGAPPRYESKPGKARRILLADDNVDFATTMSTLMRGMGHDVQVTHDGEEALAAITWFQPEFSFIDIGMPKINGYEVARAIRAMSSTQHSVLVAVTGWGQDHDQRRAFDAGFDHHLVKPVALEQIQAILSGEHAAA